MPTIVHVQSHTITNCQNIQQQYGLQQQQYGLQQQQYGLQQHVFSHVTTNDRLNTTTTCFWHKHEQYYPHCKIKIQLVFL